MGEFDTTEETKTPKIKFGDTVKYIDGKGHEKLAIVTATKETIAGDSSVEGLSKGFVGITVFSVSGKTYSRYGVPTEKAAAKAGGYTDESGEFRRIVRPL